MAQDRLGAERRSIAPRIAGLDRLRRPSVLGPTEHLAHHARQPLLAYGGHRQRPRRPALSQKMDVRILL